MIPLSLLRPLAALTAGRRCRFPRSLLLVWKVLLAAGVAGLLATPGEVRAQGACEELFNRYQATGDPADQAAFEECEAREHGGAGPAALGGGGCCPGEEPIDDARTAGAGTVGLVILLLGTLLTPIPGDEVVAGATLGGRLLAWLRGSRVARGLANLLGRNPLTKPPWAPGTPQQWGTVRTWLVDMVKSGKIRDAKDLQTALETAANGLGTSRTSLINNYITVDKFLRGLLK